MKDNIKIDRINVRNLGPVNKFSLRANDLNLIYGKNETGKTFLVEFIIRCLFKKKLWNLRKEHGQGKVTVRGLGEKDVKFSPSSDKKLQYFIEDRLPGLSPAVDKLIIVKGARLEIEPGVESANHMEVLKTYLSGRKILKEIGGKIKKSIKRAKIEKKSIDIKHKPNIDKVRENSQEKISKINNLLQKLNEKYSLGPIFECKRKINELKDKKEKYGRAKRHHAYRISNKIEKMRRKEENLADEEQIKKLASEISTYRQLKAQAEEIRDDIKIRKEDIVHLDWLREAEDTYVKIMDRGVSPVFYRGLLVGLVVVAGLLVFFNYPLISLIPLVLVASLPFILKPRSVNANEEIKNIKKNYRDYFAEELKDTSTIKAKLKQLSNKQAQLKAVEDSLQKIKEKIKNSRTRIQKMFLEITKPPPFEDKWDSVIEDKEKERKKVSQEIKELEIEFSSLNIQPEDFIEEETEYSYDRDSERETLKELQRQRDIFEHLQKPIEEIRTRIRELTGVARSSDENLINELLSARREAEKEYAHSTSSILGQWSLAKVVEKLSGQEEEKIKSSLKKESLRQPVEKFTSKYKSFELKGNKLFLSDGYSQYCLDEVSSGAREQIFLGLRLGMAAELFGKNRVFFILDDAFQYSDWDRRDKMVDKAVEMASCGWQIFYFTMDDHIRELFKKKARKSPVGFTSSEIK